MKRGAALIVLLSAATLVNAQTTVPSSGPAEKTCLAVLEPELRADLPEADRKAASSALETVLTESLSSRKEFVLVDRQALETVLDEHKLPASGRLASNSVAASLRPFWTAGVILCSQVDGKSSTVAVEAVSAQTGALLSAVYVRLVKVDAKSVAGAVEPKLKGFLDQTLRAASVAAGKPLVEVTAELVKGLEQSRWLSDEAAEAARARVLRNSTVSLLTPRHPLQTKEERLLRLMGLASPAKGDAAAALRAAPDFTVRMGVTEETVTGGFDKTPMSLTVEILAGNRKRSSKTFTGVAGKWSEMLLEVSAWLDKELPAAAGNTVAARQEDDEAAIALARAQMTAMEPWMDLATWQLRELPDYLRLRFLDIAMRAGHLDPTNERAAYMTAMNLHFDQDNLEYSKRSEACDQAIMREGQRYVERFGAKTPPHHRDVLGRIVRIGMTRLWLMQGQDKPGQHRLYSGGQAMLEPPDPQQYEYARVYIRAMAQYGILGLKNKIYADTNDFFLLGLNVTARLVPSIPADRLEEEYAWWKDLYAREIDTLPAEERYKRSGVEAVVPWEMVDAFFAARRKDAATVRKDLQAVARIYPLDATAIWGGNEYKQDVVPVLLRACGDPDWKTWRPAFGARKDVRVSLNEMTAFMATLSTQTPDYWEYGSLPTLAGTDIEVPRDVRQAALQKGSYSSNSAEAVLLAGQDVWLTAPGQFPGNSGSELKLFVGRLRPEGQKRLSLDAQAIPWEGKDKLDGKPHWSYAYAIQHAGKWVAFMGTDEHGLLRLDQADGKWTGRWITTKHGLPSNGVSRLALCMNGKQEELLIMGGGHGIVTRNGMQMQAYVYMISSLNLESGKVTLLYDGGKDTQNIYHPTAVLKDGSKVILELSGSGAYEKPVDIGQIDKITTSGFCEMSEVPTPYTIEGDDGGKRTRLWYPNWDGPNLRYNLAEYDTRTLKMVEGAGPPPGSTRSVSAEVSRQASDVLGTIMAWPGTDRAAAMDRWPNKGGIFAAGGRGILWMAFKTDMSWDWSRCIVGYQPAPVGSKDWAAEDLWIGPFKTPGNELILGFRQEVGGKRLVLSTTGHVCLLDDDELLALARKSGAVHSTQQWRADYDRRLAKTGWKSLVPAMILDGNFDQALKMIDDAKAKQRGNPRAMDGNSLDVWRARILADEPGKLDQAIAAYDSLAAGAEEDGAMEAFARANQVVLLHRAGKWKELQELCQRLKARFPQMKERGESSGLGWFAAQARQKLAAQSQPSDPAGPKSTDPKENRK